MCRADVCPTTKVVAQVLTILWSLNKQHSSAYVILVTAPGPRPFFRVNASQGICPLIFMEGVDFTLDSWLPSHSIIHGYTGFSWLYGEDDQGVCFFPWMWERNWIVGGFPFVCKLAAGAVTVGVLCVVGRCLLWRLGQWRKWLKRPLSSPPRPEQVGNKLAGKEGWLENFEVNVISIK